MLEIIPLKRKPQDQQFLCRTIQWKGICSFQPNEWNSLQRTFENVWVNFGTWFFIECWTLPSESCLLLVLQEWVPRALRILWIPWQLDPLECAWEKNSCLRKGRQWWLFYRLDVQSCYELRNVRHDLLGTLDSKIFRTLWYLHFWIAVPCWLYLWARRFFYFTCRASNLRLRWQRAGRFRACWKLTFQQCFPSTY